MTILAMQATKAEPHPNADSLRIYEFTAPGVDAPVQIVGNMQNVYEVGDTAAVALVNTVLEDGTLIKKSKLRGTLSFGMAMGPTTEAVGTDLTEAFKATTREKVVDESQGVVEESVWPRYTSIPGYLKIRDEILACDEVIVTEKSHGSNARFGFHGDTFMVGTHTSKVIPSRMSSETWPKGHLVAKLLQWVEGCHVEDRVAHWREAHPEVKSLAVYGGLMGYKCSDLHYGMDFSTVRLFGEVCLDGLALEVLAQGDG